MTRYKNFFLTIILTILAQSAFAADDTRVVSSEPKEIYGEEKDNIQVRIGNGGAGPTGILRALAEDYLQESGKEYAIAWYQDISVNTLKQLQNGVIDIALVYEKSQGEAAQKEGWATNYTPIFNDHFLIVGPRKNLAKLSGSDSAADAFLKISKFGEAKSVPTFLSRNDNSGTNVKEQSIWNGLNLKPWEGDVAWYFKYSAFPKDALLQSDKDSLYTITDWGTWLSNQDEIQHSEIFVRGGPILSNPCFALLGKNPTVEALAFLDYLKSERGQQIIANFGAKSHGGLALFTQASRVDF